MKKIENMGANLSILKTILILTACLFAISCGGSKNGANSSDKKKIKLAAVSFNIDEVNNKVAIDALKAKGYEVEVIVLEDATTMNEAAMNGEIDASLHQHKPWMDSYNKSKNREMVMLEPYIHYNPFGMYSAKIKNVSEVPQNAKAVIPQDPSNAARALSLLEQQGLITLKKGVELPTLLDIETNPKNIQFTQVNTAQVMKSLQDVDFVCVAKIFVISSNINDVIEIATSSDVNQFAVGFVINPANKDAKWTKDLTDAYTSPEMKAEIAKIFKGGYVTLD